MQDPPSSVPAVGAKQGGENPAPIIERRARRERWAWAEASIWTDRMLAALEEGVKGGCWFHAGPTPTSPSWACSRWTGPSVRRVPVHDGGPLTGKPDAGDPPVRFGGRGGRDQPAFPTPISRVCLEGGGPPPPTSSAYDRNFPTA
jgi:hypothetical protein